MQPTFNPETTALMEIVESCLDITPMNWEEAQVVLDAQQTLDQILDLEQLLLEEAEFIPAIEM